MGAELSAFGVNDAETCRCNIRLCFYVKYTLVGVVNELFSWDLILDEVTEMWSSPLSKPTLGVSSATCPMDAGGFRGIKWLGHNKWPPTSIWAESYQKIGALDVLPFTSFVAYVIRGVEVCSNKDRRNVNIGMVEQSSNSVVRLRRTA